MTAQVSGPCYHVAHLDIVPGFCLHFGPALPVVGIWGVSQQLESLSLLTLK